MSTRYTPRRGAEFLKGLTHVAVGGMGVSGRAAARLLVQHGIAPLVVDGRRQDVLEASGGPLPPGCGYLHESDGHAAARLAGSDLLVISPGIDTRRDPWAAALNAGVPCISEVELGWRFADAPMAAVTGSNGKSTVVTVLGQLLAAAGFDARVCGNIGIPLTAALEKQTDVTRFAVEVSSFQLEQTLSLAPAVGVLLNVTPDHMDRYVDFGSYHAAKERLFIFQGPAQHAVIGVENTGSRETALRLAARAGRGSGPQVLPVAATREDCGVTGEDDAAFLAGGQFCVRMNGDVHRLGPVTGLPLPGRHNQLNVLTALTAALLLGAEPGRLRPALRDLKPLAHRMETVGEGGGIRFINDSKATNVESTATALAACPRGKVLLLLGGRHKGGDFDAVAPALARHARKVFVFGESGPAIARALAAAGRHDLPQVEPATDLAAAFAAAVAAARHGDVVLLSPACASFDAYSDYTARGEHFRALVRGHLERLHGA